MGSHLWALTGVFSLLVFLLKLLLLSFHSVFFWNLSTIYHEDYGFFPDSICLVFCVLFIFVWNEVFFCLMENKFFSHTIHSAHSFLSLNSSQRLPAVSQIQPPSISLQKISGLQETTFFFYDTVEDLILPLFWDSSSMPITNRYYNWVFEFSIPFSFQIFH